MLSRLSKNQIIEAFIRRSAKAKKSHFFLTFFLCKKSELISSYYMWLPFPLALARKLSMHICAYDAIYFREFIARVYRSNRKCAHICWNGTHDRAILDYRVPFCSWDFLWPFAIKQFWLGSIQLLVEGKYSTESSMAIYPLNSPKTITSRASIECVCEKSREDDDNDRVRFLLISDNAFILQKLIIKLFVGRWRILN